MFATKKEIDILQAEIKALRNQVQILTLKLDLAVEDTGKEFVHIPAAPARIIPAKPEGIELRIKK
jgi:hypothetical protein